MKKPYERMKVSLVGAVSNVINKSGCWNDLSRRHESKTKDNGKGNGGYIC